MKSKFLFTCLVAIFTCSTMLAQKVKFKKGKVELDGEQVLSFERRNLGNEISIYTLDGEDELIFMIHDDNETENYDDDDYRKMVFINQKITIESSSLSKDTWKSVLKILFKEKVLGKDGTINEEKLEVFNAKYGKY